MPPKDRVLDRVLSTSWGKPLYIQLTFRTSKRSISNILLKALSNNNYEVYK